MFIGETQHVASDRIQYAIRYDGWLNTSVQEQLSTADAVAVNYSLATIDTITIESPSNQFFTFYLTGGSAGDIFQINLDVTTTLGQRRQDYMRVVVGPNGEAYSYSASLIGPTGPTGASGTNGTAGATGPTGPSFASIWTNNPTPASPPTKAGGTWTNLNFAASTTAVDFTEGLTGIRLKTLQPSNALESLRGLIKAAPATPYDLIGRFRRQQPIAIGNGGSVHHALGLIMRETSTGKGLIFGLGNNNASNVSLVRFYFSDNDTYASGFETWGSAGISDVPWEWYLKINNDGTNLKFYFSLDGWYYNYVDKVALISSGSPAGPFTTSASHVGWGMSDGWWTVNTDANATPEIIVDCGGWSCS